MCVCVYVYNRTGVNVVRRKEGVIVEWEVDNDEEEDERGDDAELRGAE